MFRHKPKVTFLRLFCLAFHAPKPITSVENIYKLRGDIIPTSLNNAEHVLISANAGLAYSAAVFDRKEFDRGYFTIPTVLTDTLVGTFIWVQEPAKLVEDFNKNKLIAYTNAVISPKPNLLRRFTQEIDIAKRNTVNPITEESAIILLENSIARSLLADKTLGDPDRVTAQTPYEVLEELKIELSIDEKRKTEDALRLLNETKTEKEFIEQQFSNQTANILQLINIVAVWGKRIIVGLLFLLAALLLAINEFQEPRSLSVRIVTYVLALISVASGVTITYLGTKVERWIKARLRKLLLRFEND